MRSKRLILCRGQFCNLDRRADKLYQEIAPIIVAINGDVYPPKIQLATANCLSMCGAGPNGIMQPEARPFNHLTIDSLKQIIETHLRDEL